MFVSGSDQSFPPSFRMHRNYSFPVRGGSHNHLRKDRRRTRLLNQLKKSAGHGEPSRSIDKVPSREKRERFLKMLLHYVFG